MRPNSLYWESVGSAERKISTRKPTHDEIRRIVPCDKMGYLLRANELETAPELGFVAIAAENQIE